MHQIFSRWTLALALTTISVGPAARSEASDTRADFAFCSGAEPKTLDPHRLTGVIESRIAEALFEGLTYRDHDTLRPVPGSAASWEISPDGRRYVFHLRKDARWSDGTPVTADDFVYSWKRLLDPATASEYAFLFHAIRHAEAYNTYAAQLTALHGDPDARSAVARQGILGGIKALVAGEPEGLPVATWQEFASRREIRGILNRPVEREIIDALDRPEGRFSPLEGNLLVAAFELEVNRRAGARDAAQYHFGVDQGVFASDPQTLVVELVAFVPTFLELTSSSPALPVRRSSVEGSPYDWTRRPSTLVGNGPFQLDDWEVGRRMRLRKSETYWGRAEVKLRTVDAISTSDNQKAWDLYQAGAVDWLPATYPAEILDAVKERPDFHVTRSSSTHFYRFNATRKPFDDARVRLALAKSIDRAQLVEKISRKGEPVLLTVAPAGSGGGYDPPESRMGFDPAAACAELAKAGYPDGKGFPKFTLLYNTSEGHKRYAEFVISQWRTHLGIEATPVNVDWGRYIEKQARLDYDVCRAGWVADVNDPGNFLEMWTSHGVNNNTGWGDRAYDGLMDYAADPFRLAADATPVLAQCKELERMTSAVARLKAAPAGEGRLAAARALRFQILREAEAILVQDAFPILPLFGYVNTGLVSPRVRNFRSRLTMPDGSQVDNLEDLHPFRNLVVEPQTNGGR